MNVSENKAQFKDIEKFVFVVTYGRSGSTLIQNILNSIDGFCIRGENANILASLGQAWAIARNSTNIRNLVNSGKQTSVENPWFGAENIKADRLGRRMAHVFFQEVLAPPSGTRATGFKEIRWTQNPNQFATTLNYAFHVFPNTKFIFNTRNHEAVSQSGWWANMPQKAVFERLTEAEKLFNIYLEKHPERCASVHYDDYIKDPLALMPMFQLIDEPYDPAMIKTVMARQLTHLKTDEN